MFLGTWELKKLTEVFQFLYNKHFLLVYKELSILGDEMGPLIKENMAGKVGMWKKMGMNTRAISKVPCVSSSIIFSFLFCYGICWH